MDVRVKFLGGAGTVTGSKYLLEIDEYRLLIDCGLFQGLKQLRLRNWDALPLEENTIDAVVLTHAHIDHSGYLPRLVKEGFNGPIHCTGSTADLLRLLLLDSAKLQEEEAEWAKKKGYSKHENPQPLYDTKDVNETLPLVQSHRFNQRFYLTPSIEVNFVYGGHILGASIVEVYVHGSTQSKKLVFSGDLGRESDPILYPPEKIAEADILFVESTYGNRNNEFVGIKEALATAINETFDRKGCVLIPAFSVGRTQNLLMYIKDLMTEGAVPEAEVFMDSPMAISATEIYTRHMDDHKLTDEMLRTDESFLTLGRNLITVRTREASAYLNNKKEHAIIISASGMMTGGRILHHLFHRLPRTSDTLLIVGYQGMGTRGRDLLDGAKSIRIFGEEVTVKCNVVLIDGLSAHADMQELHEWLGHFTVKPKKTFIVHGEPESAEYLRRYVEHELQWNAYVPDYLESFALFNGI
jgi:metallo-beta-lactamase family protein